MYFDEPSGCKWCGASKQSHCGRWTRYIGWHQWTMPSIEQIKERMIYRREARKNAKSI